jgi:predicted nucleotidyltransferase
MQYGMDFSRSDGNFVYTRKYLLLEVMSMNELGAIINQHKGLSEWCALHVFRGSVAHGMYIPPENPDSIDDVDTMAICIPDKEYYLGMSSYGSRGTREIKQGKWDIVVYELRKAMGMMANCNPNILSMLWTDEKDIIHASMAGLRLRGARKLFVSKRAYNAYKGYSYSQFKKMTSGKHLGYMGEKRKQLVERYGYDTKNAAHMIRLLRMGIEFLSTGSLNVLRSDAGELLEIKRGKWSLEKVKSEAEILFERLEDANLNSQLPDEPDREAINRLCVEMVEIQWGDAALRKSAGTSGTIAPEGKQ